MFSKIMTILIVLLVLPGLLCAQGTYKYNHRPENELKYNPFENTWTYERKDSQLQYNPFENKWEYTIEGAQLLYNPFSGKWEFEK
jgi:hypothetical protein